MITLKKDGVVMRVADDIQASVFIRSGYEVVSEAEEKSPAAEEPKRRRRPIKKDAAEAE